MKLLLSLLLLGATISSFSQLSVDAFSTPYTINFDASVTDVNNDAYNGTGLDVAPAAGQLDSDAWEIGGCSDGDITFGATATTGDYAVGSNTGGISVGGLYAFDVASSDFAFGFQPTGGDLTPGYITLRILNNTGGAIGSIDISYEAWILNDFDRSNSLTFSYSDDNSSFTTVPSLDLASIEAQDVSPVWTVNNQSATISGLSIQDGAFFYLRWDTDDISGSGSRDEFGIDDITISATQATPTVNIDAAYYSVSEDAGTVDVAMTLTNSNGASSAIKVMVLNGSTASPLDYTMPSGLGFDGVADETLNFVITLNDDAIAERAEYISLVITDSSNVAIGNDAMTAIYISDNDYTVPVGNESIMLEFIDSITVVGGSAEISDFDPNNNRLYTANSVGNTLEIIDMVDPANIASISSIDVSTYGNVNSVAVKNGVVALALANSVDKTADGLVVFFDEDGVYINEVTVGANPDMVVFTPDNNGVLVANEGEPSDDYTSDPEGTVSIIDISNGVASATVTTADFNAFDSQVATLAAGGMRVFGPGATLSMDVEPEYITIDSTSTTAWVTLQENNAIAVLDIQTATITSIIPLGVKDHMLPENAMDVSNDAADILIANWPVYGYYMPDAIAHFYSGGSMYLVTANEGDSRDYTAYSEEERIKDIDLEDANFGAFESFLQVKENAGRLKVTIANGDTEGDTDYDSIYVYGTRSFSIWDMAGNLVWDSGDNFEQITAADPTYGAIFNCSNDNVDLKDRSDDKGPEPEGITTAVINDTVYAFITLERTGGVMVYDVTTPTAPNFVQYINNRDIGTATGDLAPEGIIFISAEDSPIDTALLVVSNEVSATVSVYKVNQSYPVDDVSVEELEANQLLVYPNPTENMIFFNQPLTFSIVDITGKEVANGVQLNKMDVSHLSSGVYIIRTQEGRMVKFSKR